ncbi:hypothetical protein E4U31_007604 [Claviceps sp. LM219 group G6]|nr:hypothetical protein E4U31_007604 [Claviceps sp. LM219 group G6]
MSFISICLQNKATLQSAYQQYGLKRRYRTEEERTLALQTAIQAWNALKEKVRDLLEKIIDNTKSWTTPEIVAPPGQSQLVPGSAMRFRRTNSDSPGGFDNGIFQRRERAYQETKRRKERDPYDMSHDDTMCIPIENIEYFEDCRFRSVETLRHSLSGSTLTPSSGFYGATDVREVDLVYVIVTS